MRPWIAAAVLCASAIAFGQQIPRPSPDFTATIPGTAKRFNIAAYKGKVIALEFLLTGCSHCQDTARHLAKLERELGPKGFLVLGVATDPTPDIEMFRQVSGATFPIGVSPSREAVLGYLQRSVMQPNMYMPQLVFIDAKGMIRAQYGGEAPFFEPKAQEKNLRDMINNLISENAPAPKPAATKKKKAS